MNDNTEPSAIFAPIWRRKWLILSIAIIISVVSYLYYKRQPTVYQAKTQLYLGASSEGRALLNNTLGKASVNSTTLANQALLINTTVGEKVHKKLRAEHDPAAAKAKVKAKASAAGEFITITAEARTAKAASVAANAYAVGYIAKHQSEYIRSVNEAIETTRKQISRIETAQLAAEKAKATTGKGTVSAATTLQSASLNTRINELESDLTVNGVTQVGIAKPGKAELLAPTPKKNAIFGFAVGLVLASVAAYILSRFDRRLRSLGEVEAMFKRPILAALPFAKTPIVRGDGDIRPSRRTAEQIQRLQTVLHLQRAGEDGADAATPGSILFISADAGDGKSTLAAGLALVQRSAGQRVAIVEGDFRRPIMGRLLGLLDAHGLADVLTGTRPVRTAMQEVHTTNADGPVEEGEHGGVATVVQGSGTGVLSVLVGGTGVPNPPALLASQPMVELMQSLSAEYDSVLVDGPPPLQVSDVLPLMAMVDGIVLVARVGHTREVSARRLAQLLERTPGAPILGVVANGVSRSDMEKYGFSSLTGERRWRLLGG